jgi:hypothetical protein
LTRDRDRSRYNAEARRQYDRVRDQWLRSQGFQILRYWNNEIFDEWEAIAEAVWKAAQGGPLTPGPLYVEKSSISAFDGDDRGKACEA